MRNGGILGLVPSSWSLPNALRVASSPGRNSDVESTIHRVMIVTANKVHLEFKMDLAMNGASVPQTMAVGLSAIAVSDTDFIAFAQILTPSVSTFQRPQTLTKISRTIDGTPSEVALDVLDANGTGGALQLSLDGTRVVNRLGIQTSRSVPTSVMLQLGIAFQGTLGNVMTPVAAEFDDVVAR